MVTLGYRRQIKIVSAANSLTSHPVPPRDVLPSCPVPGPAAGTGDPEAVGRSGSAWRTLRIPDSDAWSLAPSARSVAPSQCVEATSGPPEETKRGPWEARRDPGRQVQHQGTQWTI
uniref:Uncharacterized protein n=1 Tax=Knipowitschia caucasica TaxID=637954 RepID=A0AAV2L101_KNICA